MRGGQKNAAFLALASDLDPRKADRMLAWAGERSFRVSRELSGEELGDIVNRAFCDVILVYDPGLVRSLGKTLGRD